MFYANNVQWKLSQNLFAFDKDEPSVVHFLALDLCARAEASTAFH